MSVRSASWPRCGSGFFSAKTNVKAQIIHVKRQLSKL